LRWPSLHTRAMACRSTAGFQSLSNRTRRLAPTRFSPAPPARVDSKQICTPAKGLRKQAECNIRRLLSRSRKSASCLPCETQISCLCDRQTNPAYLTHKAALFFEWGVLYQRHVQHLVLVVVFAKLATLYCQPTAYLSGVHASAGTTQR